uniref:Uncharacterized protein n=1 Tax=viral metagenome TaxID=1070528 RepID=A0A6M3M5K8_9ZZZZ
MSILLGFEVGSGKEVYLPPGHTVITGMTQFAGKCLFPMKMTRSQIALGIRLTTKDGYFNGAFNKLRKNKLIISAGGDDWILSEGPP